MTGGQLPGGPAPGEPLAGPGLGGSLRRVAARAIAIAGAAVAFAGGVVAAVVGLLLVPLRLETGLGVLRVPVAIVFTLGAAVLLLWFGRAATGVRWGVLAPPAGWFLVMLPALGTTTEGARLLMPNDWVGTLTLFGGTIVWTIGAVFTIATPRGPHQPSVTK